MHAYFHGGKIVMSNKEIQSYLKSIVKMIPAARMTRKRIFNELSDSVSQFLEDHPDASQEELISHLGTAEEVAAQYIEHLSAAEISGKMRWRKVNIVLGIFICSIVLTVGIYLFFVITEGRNATVVYYTDTLHIETLPEE